MSNAIRIIANSGAAEAWEGTLTVAQLAALTAAVSPTGDVQTQGTSKSTAVTLSQLTGLITMHAANLAADAIVSFTLTNTFITSTDIILIEHVSGGTSAAYTVNAFPGSGSAVISVKNNTAGTLGEAIVLRFIIIRSANA
jgi:hypothetical protein